MYSQTLVLTLALAGLVQADSSDWELTNSQVIFGLVPAQRYVSKKTGMALTLAQPNNPMVDGYFCAPTEAFNDDGIPHVLEHLIFQGRLVPRGLCPLVHLHN